MVGIWGCLCLEYLRVRQLLEGSGRLFTTGRLFTRLSKDTVRGHSEGWWSIGVDGEERPSSPRHRHLAVSSVRRCQASPKVHVWRTHTCTTITDSLCH
ncbi:hypothetical protein VTO42DRAFT_2074 [Malbranchea cinnamomea]